MTYNWISFGETSWPKIAFISPSSGFSGRQGQLIIISRIQSLNEIGICVLVPEYENGGLNEIRVDGDKLWLEMVAKSKGQETSVSLSR